MTDTPKPDEPEIAAKLREAQGLRIAATYCVIPRYTSWAPSRCLGREAGGRSVIARP